MDSIKSNLTSAERQELFRQFKCAMQVKALSVKRTTRIFEGQLTKFKSSHHDRNGTHFSRIPASEA